MPIITFTPAINSPFPPCTIPVNLQQCLTVQELRELVAGKYYLKGRQVILIRKGKVLSDQMELSSLKIRDNERMHISIDYSAELQTTQTKQIPIEEPIEQPIQQTAIADKKTQNIRPKEKFSGTPSRDTENDKYLQGVAYLLQMARLKQKGSSGDMFANVFRNLLHGHYRDDYYPQDQDDGQNYEELKAKYGKHLEKLKDMGIVNEKNEKEFLEKLRRYRGDIQLMLERMI